MTEKKDPLEGFQITGYDEATGTLTIEVHPKILGRPDQKGPLTVKAIQIITEGPNVSSVDYVPRSED